MFSGLHVVSILSELRKLTEYTKFNDRKKGVELLSEYLNHTLLMQQKLGSRGAACLTKYRGFYLSMWYLVVKLLFTLNVIGQFFFLALVFGENNLLWGIGIVRDLLAGREWKQSGTFPRITYCDFPVSIWCNLDKSCFIPIFQLNFVLLLAS